MATRATAAVLPKAEARLSPLPDAEPLRDLPLLLLPASPAWPHDPWRAEAVAAEQAGFVTHRVDVRAAVVGRPEAVATRVPPGQGTALFRGPPLSSEVWGTLADALAGRGIRLVPSRAERDACHLVPSSEAHLGPAGSGAVCLDGFDADAAWAAFQALGGGAVVHDHQSPCSQPSDGMMWLPQGSPRAAVDAAIAEVLAQRGADAVGGLVLRRPVVIEAAQRLGEPPTERLGRAVCFRGVDLLDSGIADLADGPKLPAIAARLADPFLCVDVALAPDGRGVLVGVDDASTVELPAGTDLVAFYRALRHALR